jgi:hypothetical protein
MNALLLLLVLAASNIRGDMILLHDHPHSSFFILSFKTKYLILLIKILPFISTSSTLIILYITFFIIFYSTIINYPLPSCRAHRSRAPHGSELPAAADLSYGPPWAHYLGGYQDRLLGGPLGLPGLRYMASNGVEYKDYRSSTRLGSCTCSALYGGLLDVLD